MTRGLVALLVSEPEGMHRQLQRVLEPMGVRVRLAETCAQVRHGLEEHVPPAIIFSPATLPDGTWKEVVRLAGSAPRPTPVVVVSRFVNIGLYIESLESGASDFIVPPFYDQDISHVLRGATWQGGEYLHRPVFKLSAGQLSPGPERL